MIFLNSNPVCDPRFLFILFVALSSVFVQLSVVDALLCNVNAAYTL